MLHTMHVRVVTCRLAGLAPCVHKAYYFCPSMLSAQGIKDIDQHIETEIDKDIVKFKENNPIYQDAAFVIQSAKDVPSAYIG